LQFTGATISAPSAGSFGAGTDLTLSAGDEIFISAPGEVQTSVGTEVWIGISSNASTAILEVAGSAYKSDGSTLWTNTSDRRIKRDIKDIKDPIEKIMQLRPVTYYHTDEYIKNNPYATNNEIKRGFIAQEYQAVFPEDVEIGEDKEHLLGLRPDAIAPYTVAAVQQLIKDNEQQAAQIAVLTGQINKLYELINKK
jgi:hypothetical protein